MLMAKSGAPRNGIALAIERFAPLGVSVACMVAIYAIAPAVIAKFQATNGWQISSLYGAVFNWSAIQTGFAFGVYGFVVGKNDGFVQEIRDMLAMRRFLGYVKRANVGASL